MISPNNTGRWVKLIDGHELQLGGGPPGPPTGETPAPQDEEPLPTAINQLDPPPNTESRNVNMNLPDTIYAHALALPADLQRETLDFIAYLEYRYRITPPPFSTLSTQAFLERFAGSVGDDFPNDIDDIDLGADDSREAFE
jgi:hypothetical protein